MSGCTHGNLTAHGRDCPWCRVDRLEAENARIRAANEEADKILADGVRELQAENAELRLEIIAATGQAQTALEENDAWAEKWLAERKENAKLRGLMQEALSNMEYDSPSLGEMWLVQDSDITSMQAALEESDG